LRLGFYLGMLSEDFEVCGFGVESDLCVGPVAEGLVAGAPHLHKAVKTLPSK